MPNSRASAAFGSPAPARRRPSSEHIALSFRNTGKAGAVFHVYDKHRLQQAPRRYTVEPGKELHASWLPRDTDGAYDLWVLGPNGFHRHYTSQIDGTARPQVSVAYDVVNGGVSAQLRNPGRGAVAFILSDYAYHQGPAYSVVVPPGGKAEHSWTAAEPGCWYDFSVHVAHQPCYLRRFAGRVETGRDSTSDPAMGMVTAWPFNLPSNEKVDANWQFLFQMMEESTCVTAAPLL